MEAAEFIRHIRVTIDLALAAAKESPDVRHEEPHLVRLVALMRDNREHVDLAQSELVALGRRVASTPDPAGGEELLAYAVHSLDLPELVGALEALRDAERPHPTGRAWEHARRMHRILEARDPAWDARDLFPSLAE